MKPDTLLICETCGNDKFLNSLSTLCVDTCETDELLYGSQCFKCTNYMPDCKSCISITNCTSCNLGFSLSQFFQKKSFYFIWN